MKLLYNIFHIQNSKSKCYGSDRISLMKTWLLNNINCKKKCIKEVPSNREKVWHFLCHILWHQSRFNRISYWLSLLTLNKGGYTRDQKFWQPPMLRIYYKPKSNLEFPEAHSNTEIISKNTFWFLYFPLNTVENIFRSMNLYII